MSDLVPPRFVVLPVVANGMRVTVHIDPLAVSSIAPDPDGHGSQVNVGRGTFRSPLTVAEVLELVSA